jgi:exopolysaccharide biosynthesis polyprenyl glycosylphosphotransferase
MSSLAETPATAQASAEETLAARLALLQPAATRHSAARFRGLIAGCELTLDLLTVTLSLVSAYSLYERVHAELHTAFSFRSALVASFTWAVVIVFMLDRAGAYSKGNSLLRVRETEQILRVSTQSFFAAMVLGLLAKIPVPISLLAWCFGVVPVALFVQKTGFYIFVHMLLVRGYGNERVMIYGAGGVGRRLFSALSRSPKLGLIPVALVDDDPNQAGRILFDMGYDRQRSAEVLSGPVNSRLLKNHAVDLIIIANPSMGRERFLQTAAEALAANAGIAFVPQLFALSNPWMDYRDLDGVLLASMGAAPRRAAYEIAKRACDIVVSLTLMLIGIPIFLLIALLIKLDSPGPILFRQERVGRGGVAFPMFKFRTMATTAPPYEFSPRDSQDARITRIGRWLRRSSLDELPQLLNVLRGEMSLVGPRPEMPFIVARYTEQERARLAVPPGLTGLWQLSGDRNYMIHDNIEYDLYYIQHRNFFMDTALLLHTMIFAMRGI